MAETLKSYTIPNLIQGVSQQAAQNRRDSQCESQFDCINSPVVGCEARPPLVFGGLLASKDYSNSFFYEIRRGASERYVMVISASGVIAIYNLATGAPVLCTNTIAGGVATYLTTSGNPKDVLRAATVEDFTFIVNREKVPAMSGSSISAARPNNAIVYFKAAAYQTTYQLSVTVGGIVYIFTYTTPTNAAAASALYVQTNAVARAFYKTLTGAAPTTTATNSAATSTNQNAGAAGGDDPAAAGAAILLTAIGFTVRIMGSVLLLSRADATPFTLDCSDGNGNVMMFAVKDTAQNFDDLPRLCFNNFITKVKGANNLNDDDYWVQYKGGDGASGHWEEVVAPSTPLTFDPTTMPVVLKNTNVNTFTTDPGTWGNRVAGDATTAPNPSFIGRPIKDMVYDHQRLCILTEGAAAWSKVNNPFVYFPSSMQTTLATDPVDVKVAGGKQIALLERIVQAGEQTFLWAQKGQFRVTSGQERFQQETVEAKPLTSFEYADHCDPLQVADDLYFATDVAPWAAIREFLSTTNNKGLPPDITGHIKKYIPSGVRRMSASDTLSLIGVQTDGYLTGMFIYNYLVSASDTGQVTRAQSAWNTWRFPTSGSLLWFSILSNSVSLFFQRPDGVMYCTIDLGQDTVDPEVGALYRTRLDYLVSSASLSTPTYNSGMNESTFTLPYQATEGTLDNIKVAQRSTTADKARGDVWEVTSVSGTTVKVRGDIRTQPFYVGYQITAERTETRFHLKGPQGYIPTERLQVTEAVISHADTSYYRAEVTYNTVNLKKSVSEYTGRQFGSPLNLTGTLPAPQDGTIKVGISSKNDEFTLRLVNDSFLPSRWQAIEYHYIPNVLARPSRQQ